MPPRLRLSLSLVSLLGAVGACGRPTTAVAASPARSFAPSPPAPAVPIEPGVAAVPVRVADAGAPPAELPPTRDGAAVVRRGQCFVRTAMVIPCHGAPLPEPPAPMRVELCDGCRTDADCHAARGGRCVVVAGNTCAQPLRACRYPHDECTRCEGHPTFDADGCVHDGAGHAVCRRLGPPPPAAPR